MKLSFCVHSDAKKPHRSLRPTPTGRDGCNRTRPTVFRENSTRPDVVPVDRRICRATPMPCRRASTLTQIDRAFPPPTERRARRDRRGCRFSIQGRSLDVDEARASEPLSDELAVDILVVEIACALGEAAASSASNSRRARLGIDSLSIPMLSPNSARGSSFLPKAPMKVPSVMTFISSSPRSSRRSTATESGASRSQAREEAQG